MSAILKEANDKQTLQNPGWGGTFDVTSDLTQGVLGLYTMSYAAGANGAAPHFHKKMTEIFNVLEGSMSVLVNGEWRVVEAGGTVVIPTRIVHAFKPLPDRGCKIQILFTPNIKREEFFMDFNKYVNASDKEKYEFWAKYDQYPPEEYDSSEYGYSESILVKAPQETLYISGQVGIKEPNEDRSFAEQIDLAYVNLEKVLKEAGMSFENVVKVTELVVGNSLERLETVNNKKKKIFKRYPTSTYIPVDSLALPGMLFEIEAVAIRT